MKKFLLFFLLGNIAFAQNSLQQKRKTLANPSQQTIKNDVVARPNEQHFKATNTDVIGRYKISKNEEGQVIFIENKSKVGANPNVRQSAEAMASAFLLDVKNILKIKDPANEFKLIESQTDEAGISHLRYQQLFKNVPIYGGELILHTKGEKIDALNGRSIATPSITTQAAINAQQSIELALADVGKSSIIQKGSLTGGLLKSKEDETELVVYPVSITENKLAYHVTIKPNVLERWVYFIEAQSGEVLAKYNHTCTLDGVFKANAKDLNGFTQSINVMQKSGLYYLLDATRSMYNSSSSKLPDEPVGAIWTIDAQNSKASEDLNLAHVTSNNGTTWSDKAVSAHFNAGKCYDYFSNTFSRNSLNGKGGSIVSVINVADDDGKGMDNAFWNGEFMAYGNGRDYFKPLAGALDVAGHEMTHGVVENTAKLEYRNQSGALNESLADIFGAMIDRDDWLMGEDVVKSSAYPSGALRSLSNPNQGGKSDDGYQPKTMSQYVVLKDTPEQDNGGVHVNSGIPNYAFYLFATNSAVGKEKAEKVYYQAMNKYLFRTSKFLDMRLAVIQASKDLYGDAVANAAKSAFDTVGILDPNSSGTSGGTTTPPTPTKQDIPVNTGTAGYIVYDPQKDVYSTTQDDKAVGSLYIGSKVGADYATGLTERIKSMGCFSKPSVTDDGKMAYFVAGDRHIYAVNLTSTAAPQKITAKPEWDNVSVSKDGKRLAAISFYSDDKTITVFNLQNNNAQKVFTLYNPTYTTNVKTGDVLYADSFEWDYSGEYLIYDALNSVKSTFGNYEFWDIGIVKVWDNATNNFGNGTVEKIFSSLPKGVSLGNPTFAKTNSSIIAFDYEDTEKGEYVVVATNLETDEYVTDVAENNVYGYPDFSKDDKMITFNTYNNQEVLGAINLDTDKVTPKGESYYLFNGETAKWLVWFAQGTRALPTTNQQTITFDAIADKNAGEQFTLNAKSSSGLAVQYTVVSGSATVSGNQITAGGTAGKVTIKAYQAGNSQYTSTSAEQIFCIRPTTPKIVQNGTQITASGASNYQWYINENPIGGQTTSNAIKTDFGGAYTVKAITNDGCFSASSNAVTVSVLSVMPEVDASVVVYPNPSQEELKIELSNAIIKNIDLIDAHGMKLKSSNDNTIQIRDIPSGVYLLKITTNKGEISKRVVKD